MIHRISGTALVLGLLVACAASAETRRYALDIPAGRAVRYELELEPRHAGILAVRAEWSGGRMLSVKLEPPPGTGMTVRRNGPSPQQFELTVDALAAAARATWRLTVRSPTGRESGEGLLSVELPEPPAEPNPLLPSEPGSIDPWAAWRMPDGAPGSWMQFDVRAHRLREALLAEDRPDACRWQRPLLDYVDHTRRSLIDSGAVPSPSTRDALRVIVEAIAEVEGLRTSEDPFVAGPFPDEPRRRDAYLRVRTRQLAPLEARLDGLLRRTGRAHAPDDLDAEDWPVRIVSCLIACERHFADAPVVGAERATNAELAREQWARLLEAARTLAALADIEPAP